MIRLLTIVSLLFLSTLGAPAQAKDSSPAEDREALRKFFQSKFPDIPLDAYKDGAYIFDPKARAQFEEIEEFPPWEFDVEEGEALFKVPFKNGKTYADCFENGGIGIAQKYPLWDEKREEVVTLPLAINLCREANGEEPLPYEKSDLLKIQAFMAYTSRGKRIEGPEPTGKALEAYKKGREYYYSKRGQLHMTCANCHLQHAASRLRYELPGPLLGQTTHWPAYRSKWEELGDIQRRYKECNKQVRAKDLPYQAEEYRNLQYYMHQMDIGLEFNGPSSRK